MKDPDPAEFLWRIVYAVGGILVMIVLGGFIFAFIRYLSSESNFQDRPSESPLILPE